MINAIVLAAGESERMGKAKPLLRFQEKTFLEQIVDVLRLSDVDRTTVVLGAQAQSVKAAVNLDDADIVINNDYKKGQLSSLIAGLERIPPETEAVLLCLVDHPFITVETVNLLIGCFRITSAPIVIPTYNGNRGHPTLFSSTMFGELFDAPVEKGARYVVYSNEDKVVEVPVFDEKILFGINTPQDYKSYLGLEP